MKVAVLMGGNSDERDVSLASGVQIAGALREAGHEVVAVDTTRGGLEEDEETRLAEAGVGRLPPSERARDLLATGDVRGLLDGPGVGEADVFFLALHGGAGEDGTLQALLDAAGVRYTGSGMLGCALAMDKDVSKRLLRDAGIPTPQWLIGAPTPEEVVERIGLPVVVKASGGGSSLRLVVAHDVHELHDAVKEAETFQDLVLYERFTAGREFTVGILGDEALPVGEIIPEHEIFDYECKYQPGLAREIFPADLPEAIAGPLRRLSLRAHRVLKLGGYSRIDFLLDEENVPRCLEANALPGMTSNSLLPKAAAAAGIGFAELCDRIAREALPGTV